MYIHTPEDLQNFAREIASQYGKVLLYGDLGAGKTTFVQGFVKAFGISNMQVTSPTYTYQNIYEDKLLHIDMYRIDSLERLHETGLLELINSFDFVVIERPKREELYADESRVKVEITKAEDELRIVHHHPFK